MPDTKETTPDDQLKLAGEVASRVQINSIRLRSASFSQSDELRRNNLPPDVTLGVQTGASIDEKNSRIRVLVHFMFVSARDKKDPLLKIETNYELIYSVASLEGLSEDHFKAFAELNGCYNSWPYWREFVQSSLARMGLPPFALPVYRPQANSFQKEITEKPKTRTASKRKKLTTKT